MEDLESLILRLEVCVSKLETLFNEQSVSKPQKKKVETPMFNEPETRVEPDHQLPPPNLNKLELIRQVVEKEFDPSLTRITFREIKDKLAKLYNYDIKYKDIEIAYEKSNDYIPANNSNRKYLKRIDDSNRERELTKQQKKMERRTKITDKNENEIETLLHDKEDDILGL